MDRRRGKTTRKPYLHQVSSDFLNNADEEWSTLVSSSSSGKFREPQVKSFDFANKNVVSRVVKSKNSRKGVVFYEIICINKESTSEALNALTTWFPSDSLTDEELKLGLSVKLAG